MKISIKYFSKKELRWDLYPRFLNLMKNGFEIEAYLLILATWNFASFRYAIRSFNLDRFIRVLKNLEPDYKKFDGLDFKTIKLGDYEREVKHIFKALAAMQGIQKTGTPKLMHLRNPKVFVMWDQYIRNYYGFRVGNEKDYFNFLKKMQELFGNVKVPHNRTLAKLIDEHNYKTITIPALRKQKIK